MLLRLDESPRGGVRVFLRRGDLPDCYDEVVESDYQTVELDTAE